MLQNICMNEIMRSGRRSFQSNKLRNKFRSNAKLLEENGIRITGKP